VSSARLFAVVLALTGCTAPITADWEGGTAVRGEDLEDGYELFLVNTGEEAFQFRSATVEGPPNLELRGTSPRMVPPGDSAVFELWADPLAFTTGRYTAEITVVLVSGSQRAIADRVISGPTGCDLDSDGALSGTCGGDDCNDYDSNTHPGAEPSCGDADSDCDGELDPEDTDADNDSYSVCEGDCDDADPTIGPGLLETCEPGDENCNGDQDVVHQDLDGDGFSVCAGDCADGDPTRYPGAEEGCDGLDTDCDGLDGPSELDADGDLFSSCDGDCDDADVTVNPIAPERCNDADDDCDGTIDEDSDGDGVAPCDGDCDEADPTVYPGQFDGCDGEDDDCDGDVDDDVLNVPGDHPDLGSALAARGPGDRICLGPGDHEPAVIEGLDAVIEGLPGPDPVRIAGLAPGATQVEIIGPLLVELRGLHIVGGVGGVVGTDAIVLLEDVAVQDQMGFGAASIRVPDGRVTVDGVVVSGSITDDAVVDVLHLEGTGLSLEDLWGPMAVRIRGSGDVAGLAASDIEGVGVRLGTGVDLILADSRFEGIGEAAIRAVGAGAIALTDVHFVDLQEHALDLSATGPVTGRRVSIARAAQGVPYGSAITAAVSQLELDQLLVSDVSGTAVLLLADSVATIDHATVVATGGPAFDVEDSALHLRASVVSTGDLTVLHSGTGIAEVEDSVLWGPEPIVLGATGNFLLEPPDLWSVVGLPSTWDLHLRAVSPAVDLAPSRGWDPDGGLGDAGAYGGPEADLWDRDRDGTFDWWEPGPWPGWPWDCDDQDPARATGPGC